VRAAEEEVAVVVEAELEAAAEAAAAVEAAAAEAAAAEAAAVAAAWLMVTRWRCACSRSGGRSRRWRRLQCKFPSTRPLPSQCSRWTLPPPRSGRLSSARPSSA
jgi:hypothetical protein